MAEELQITVHGKVVIGETVKTFWDAVLNLYVEDAGMVDGSATGLASLRFDHTSHQTGTKTDVPFSIDFTVCPCPCESVRPFGDRMW